MPSDIGIAHRRLTNPFLGLQRQVIMVNHHSSQDMNNLVNLSIQNEISAWLCVSVISPDTACQKKEISCAKNIVN